MRLWNPEIVQEAPTKSLSAIHMLLCKVRSTPWGKPTARAWYYNLSWQCLVWYHSCVIRELQSRGWKVRVKWLDYNFRGNGKEPAPGNYERVPSCLKEFEEICPENKEKQLKSLKML